MHRTNAAKVMIRELEAKAMELNALVRDAADSAEDDQVQELLVVAQTHLAGWGASLEIAYSCLDRAAIIQGAPTKESLTKLRLVAALPKVEESFDIANEATEAAQ